MARKTLEITIDAENRDRGKQFLITEMGASHAETWAGRAACALLGSANIPNAPHPAEGMAGLAKVMDVGLSGLDWDRVRPLYDELLGCVEIVTESGAKVRLSPKTLDAYIEEPTTLLRLRMEVLALHVGFSADAVRSKLGMAIRKGMSSIKTYLA